MTESNPIQRPCPHCGWTNVFELTGRDDSPWDEAGLEEDTEAHIVAGYLSLNSAGLITDADVFCAELLGIDKSGLPGKPFNLFVHRDDMVDWFVHRNTLTTTRAPQSFEIRLCRGDKSVFRAKLQCRCVDEEDQRTSGMRIAIRDYTKRRQVLDQLEYFQNLNQIIAQITADLIRCPAREVDAMIEKEIKTLSVFSEVDRVYFGLVDDKKRSFVPIFGWHPPDKGISTTARKPILLSRLPEFQKVVMSNKAIFYDRTSLERTHQKDATQPFHMDGTLSYAIFPVGNDRSGRGIIGYDITRCIRGNQEHFAHLFRFTGQAILYALLRKKDESAWLERYKKALGRAPKIEDPDEKQAIVEAVSNEAGKVSPEDEDIPFLIESSSGDKIEIFDTTATKKEKIDQTPWGYQISTRIDENQSLQNVKVIDDRIVITCPRCNQQDRPSEDDFNPTGKTALVACPCGYQFAVKAEKRRLHRKPVKLEGVFVRTQGQHFRSDSMNYSGKAQIANISKQGIGFFTEGPNHLNSGDQVRIKFTLDNQSRSLITKHVLIKGVQDRYSGGQFIGADRHDITLGFYLM